MTPEPTVQDETANKSDDSAGDGVQGDHADQQECEHHQGCAALPVAVSACDHNLATPTRSATVKNTRPGWESRSR